MELKPPVSVDESTSFKRISREQLLRRLRGSRCVIPDLQSMIVHWPSAQHPEVGQVDSEVDKALRSIFTLPKDEVRFQKMKSSKIAEFGAIWWPYAHYDALLTATYMSIFLFIWDDEIDAKEFSSIAADHAAAANFRSETIAYIKASLSGASTSGVSTNPIITSFKPVGDAIVEYYDDDHVRSFRDELIFFITMCEEEQKIFERPSLPPVEEYMKRRMGSSAVRVFFSITEYACGITLPKEVRNDEAMNRIWHEANVIISITNDILSMKKEMANSQVVDSIIPLLVVELGSLQEAINHAEGIIRSSVQAFDLAVERINKREFVTAGMHVHNDIRKFVDGCKYACTANLNWR